MPAGHPVKLDVRLAIGTPLDVVRAQPLTAAANAAPCDAFPGCDLASGGSTARRPPVGRAPRMIIFRFHHSCRQSPAHLPVMDSRSPGSGPASPCLPRTPFSIEPSPDLGDRA